MFEDNNAFAGCHEDLSSGAEGLRRQLKIIIGGHAVSQDASLMIGADHFTKSASEGVAQCEQWYKERMSAVERA